MPSKAKKPEHFPFKLYAMLEYAVGSEHSRAASWIDDGRAFTIHDKNAFQELLVPKFFKQTKFRSFTRQLNLWGFRRVSRKGLGGGGGGAWRHEHFLRGQPGRLGSIRRMIEATNGKIERNEPAATGGAARSSKRSDSIASETSESEVAASVLDAGAASVPFVCIPENAPSQQRPVPQMLMKAEESPLLPFRPTSLDHASSMDQSQCQFQRLPPPVSQSTADGNRIQLRISPPTDDPNGDHDILSLLSSISEFDEIPGDADLPSIASREVREDFMAPLHFEIL